MLNALAGVSGDREVIGRHKSVITADRILREHARLTVDSGEQPIEDPGHCSGTTLDEENLEKGHPRPVDVRARIGRRDIELDMRLPNEGN